MRLITTFSDSQEAQKFSLFLEKQKVENTLDVKVDDQTQESTYSVWAHNEDQLETAEKFLQDFKTKPQDHQYDLPPPPPPESDPIKPLVPHKHRYPFFWTSAILAVCVLLFLFNGMQAYQMNAKEKKAKQSSLITPIMQWCLFDEPTLQIQFAKINEKYASDDLEENPSLEKQKLTELDQLFKEDPSWVGLYPIIVNKILYPDDKIDYEAPMFVKIRQGQIWRLVTPIFLHGGILHILFNMLWLWFLGKQIEPRLSSFRYLLLIIIIAVISNVAQYIMSGPLFLGYSGVVVGCAGFVWSRQKKAPWEGYPIQKGVFLFIGAYLIGLFLLQMIGFIALFFGKEFFVLGIANTAHLVGGLAGLCLGRLSFFKWRSHE